MAPAAEQTPPARIAVIVVSRGDGAQLKRCLDALDTGLAVVVVDNGSNDSVGLEAVYPGVRFVRLPRDFGLTKALNIGIRAVTAEMVLFLSPEVEITGPATNALADTLESETNVGAVCPLLLAPDGNAALQVSELPDAAEPDPQMRVTKAGEYVACVTCQAIMFRAFFLRALRNIDERYGDYGSSVELCRQVLRANKTILIHPVATASLQSRKESLSSAQQADREVGTYHFLAKHSGFPVGLIYLVKRVFAALFSLRLGKVVSLVLLKKVDGN